LRVDNHRGGPIVDQVAAVPEILGGDHFNVHCKPVVNAWARYSVGDKP
jgi:hypothetical protein